MKYEDILQDLRNKIYRPIYFLMGDESYFIDEITKYIHDNVLEESEKIFNQTVLYGKDTDIATVINTAKRYPMMAKHQVVIVKEAQEIKKIDDLVHYASSPLDSTILVLNYKYKSLDKRKKLYKVLEKKGVLFESAKLYENKVPAWISGYLKKRGYATDPGVPELLTEFLGNDLGKIIQNLDRLLLTLQGGNKRITANDIEKNIGISKDFNNFELQKAVAKKDVLRANRIIDYFGKNQKNNHISLTIASLYSYFSKLIIYHFIKDKSKQNVASVLKINPYFVQDYQIAARNYNPAKTVKSIEYLREYDMKSKGMGNVSTPPEELLRELIFKILH